MTKRKVTIQVTRTIQDEVEIELDLAGVPIEPKCPGCSMGIRRQKCAFELGGDCPRHIALSAYNQARRQYRGK